MSYVIVGGICLVIGACIGIFILALVSLGENTDRYENEIVMDEEDEDADW